jgi:hypothetical protein
VTCVAVQHDGRHALRRPYRTTDCGRSFSGSKTRQAGEEMNLLLIIRRYIASRDYLAARSIISVDDNMGIRGLDSDNGLNLAYD